MSRSCFYDFAPTIQDQDFSREALVTWLSLPDDFVLRFLGIYENEASQLFLVVPYMINDTLARWRKKQSPSATAVKRQVRTTFFIS